MYDFLDRTNKFIKPNEAVKNADMMKTLNHGRKGDDDQNGSENNGNGKRASSHQVSHKQGQDYKKPKQEGRQPAYEQCFTNYTAMARTCEDIFIVTENKVPYRKPILIKNDPSKRDQNKYCRYHEDHGHDINEYHQLKEKIKFLARKGHMALFVDRRQGQNKNDGKNDGKQRQRSPPNWLRSPFYVGDEPEVITLIIMICGGPHIADDNNKCRERNARDDERRETKQVSRMEDQDIAFTSKDSRHNHYPHNDLVVIAAQIANLKVLRVLVDNDSSVNILYK
ncbi:uncharacterized protein LOC133832364 [Humulus lupulus]|uniref:uncharacterized protein LOC133832364 n=1 Tax=Humulus lupulus TaxID=3486 RepID=UPI002B4045D4|nr:uncharacterized protein LOC133832364 [Humulus lupulus]